MYNKNLIIILATLLLLSGCAQRPLSSSDTQTPFEQPAASTTTGTDPISMWHWKLAKATTPAGDTDDTWAPIGNHAAIFDFDDKHLAVSGLCNQMAASYTTDGDQIRFGQVTSTMRMCPDDSLMRYEQALGQHLPKATHWQLQHNHGTDSASPSSGQTAQLTLAFDDGAKWFFTGTPATGRERE